MPVQGDEAGDEQPPGGPEDEPPTGCPRWRAVFQGFPIRFGRNAHGRVSAPVWLVVALLPSRREQSAPDLTQLAVRQGLRSRVPPRSRRWVTWRPASVAGAAPAARRGTPASRAAPAPAGPPAPGPRPRSARAPPGRGS